MTFGSVGFLIPLCVVVTSATHQNYPGTSTRPVLSDQEAALYTKEKYLEGWTPETIQTAKADYIVGDGYYSYIQEAVEAAIKAGGTTRKYIQVKKGNYAQTIIIPKTSVPITIYGTPNKPDDVHISLNQSVNFPASEWVKRVNPNGQVFKKGDAAWDIYSACAASEKIGFCCPVILAEADNLEIADMTFENPAKDAQALAARANGDKQNWYNVHFYGFQDTLFTDGGNRVYFNTPTIKGDVDFIYGDNRAVFENAQIIARADRPRATAVIFAPDTDYNKTYGFLVINSKITAEKDIADKKGCHLARAWDASSKHGDANGQLVIRESEIDNVVNVDAPWATAAGGRPYHGNTNTNRNLDDKNYNRFWEYKNKGSGA